MLKDLFDGAISVNMFENFEDASKFRQVPDHQEVFIDIFSDVSLIVEILEMPKNKDIE
jgi:hypothetical protein